MKENIKKPNCKANLWAHVSSVWYSIERKTLMELCDSMHKRLKQHFSLKEDLPILTGDARINQ